MNNDIKQVFERVEDLHTSYLQWKNISLKERINTIQKIKDNLLEYKIQCATAITTDMNKPISQSIAEIEKCAYLCDYYIKHVETFLQSIPVSTRWSKSYIEYQPLGVLLGIMPWNFPFWQVFRFAIPSMLVGNTIAIKHASNVPESAKMLEKIFENTNLHYPIYANLEINSQKVPQVIAHRYIKAISLTGSEQAGKAVAQEAGKYLKKCVLELGGSNAFIVLADADISHAIDTAVNARMQNAGQSCIAAKRFLVHKDIYHKFVKGFEEKIKKLKIGDKYHKDTQFGAMAREDLAIEVEQQVQESIKMGAVLVCGGKRVGSYYPPTILTNVAKDMPVAKEETFGPVAAIFEINDVEEAIRLSNHSDFGLGVSIFTQDIKAVEDKISDLEEGAVFVNEMVISDPHLPFGGIKKSGYGRELSHFALYEFANIRTVVINEV